MPNPAIDCKFGKAKPGDCIVLDSPFKFGEVIGRLVKIDQNGRFLMHTYELYLFGALIGTAQAKQDGAHTEWRMCV